MAARLCLATLLVVCAALCPAASAQCATAAPYNASACSTLPPTTAPVCLPASDSVVQGLLAAYPNCLPLFELATARGDGIWLPSDPHAANSSDWAFTSLVFTQIIAGSAQFARTLGTLRAVPGSSLDCLHAYIRYTCARLFRTCDLSDPRALRRAPCQDTCTLLGSVTQTADGSLTCRQLVYDFLTSPTGGNQPAANADFFLPPCDTCESGCTIDLSTPAVYGQPSYPNASQAWDLGGGLTADVACADFPIENFIQNDDTRTLFPCYKPWVPAPARRDAYCGIGCPIQLVDLNVYDGVATLCGVISWISYLLTAVVIFTMFFIPRYRRFPSCMILTAAVGAHILSFGFLFVTTTGFKKVTCEDSVTYRNGLGSSACVFQTLVFEVGISLVCWSWACIGVNSAISIGLRKDKWLRRKWCYVPQFVVTFVWPVAACIASLCIGQFAASGINIVCFTIPEQDKQRSKSWTFDWLFVYVPLAASLLVVLPTVSISIYGMRHFRDESSARIQRHVRVILFLVVFIPLLAFAFVYRVYTYQKGAKWGAAFQTWAAAAVLAPAERVAGAARPSSGLFYGSFFVFTVEGTLIALLFGTNKDIVGFWINGVRHVREGRSFFASGSTSTEEGSVEGSLRSTNTAATYGSSHY